MRHGVSFRKFSRTSAHRKMMFRNLTTQLIQHGKITTTLHKAKDLRRFAEKIVTITKRPLHSQHLIGQLCRYTTDHKIAKKALETFPLRFAARNGGYTKIMPALIRRKGDNARMASIEYIDADKTPDQTQIDEWKQEMFSRNKQLDKRHETKSTTPTSSTVDQEEETRRREQLARLLAEQERLQKLELDEE